MTAGQQRPAAALLVIIASWNAFPHLLSSLTPTQGVSTTSVARFARGFGSEEPPSAKTAQQQYKTKKGLKSTEAAIDYFEKAKEYRDAGNNQKAIQMYRKARVAIGKAAGNGSKDYARVCSDLGIAYLDVKKHDRAADLLEESRKAFEVAVGKNNAEYAGCLRNLARLRWSTGNVAAVEALLKEASHIYAADLSSFHNEYADTLKSLASLYQTQGQMDLLQPILLEEQRVRTLAASLGR